MTNAHTGGGMKRGAVFCFAAGAIMAFVAGHRAIGFGFLVLLAIALARAGLSPSTRR